MIRRVVLAVVVAGALLMLLTGTADAVDCTAYPSDPSCQPSATPTDTASPTPTATPTDTTTSSPTPTDTSTPTATATDTTTASPSPAPGTDTGVYVDPSTGSLRIDQNTGVAVGVTAWLAAVVAGLGTAKLVLP